jgi:rifampicin phosphotransferase
VEPEAWEEIAGGLGQQVDPGYAVLSREIKRCTGETLPQSLAAQRLLDGDRAQQGCPTINPLTGKRRQAVIDATPGLAETLVSGATNPDHFVVDTPTGVIVERRVGGSQMAVPPTSGSSTQRIQQPSQADVPCLSDTQVRALAVLGVRVEAHFGSPQDIEWAIDPAGEIFLVQARPITTLFPLPSGAPIADADLRVYLCFNVQQGTALIGQSTDT